MIYDYCLIVEEEIEPYPPQFEHITEDYYEQTQTNLPALLAVNTLIRAEALPVLYSKNHWRIPVVDTPDSATIFHTYSEHFHHINIAFDQRDLSPSAKARISTKIHSNPTRMYASGDVAGARARAIHSTMQSKMNKIWRLAYSSLLKHLPHAKTLTIDLEYFACPAGCCRIKILRRTTPFFKIILKHLRPKVIAKLAKKGETVPQVFIRGLVNQEERDYVIRELGFTEAS